MKKTHILGIGIILVAITAIIASISSQSTYANFSEAFLDSGKKFTVVGTLNRDKEIISAPNSLTFYMVDKKGQEKKVVLAQTKPQDFERSESITLVGRADGNSFHASDIQMKCPSKYNKVQHEISEI